MTSWLVCWSLTGSHCCSSRASNGITWSGSAAWMLTTAVAFEAIARCWLFGCAFLSFPTCDMTSRLAPRPIKLLMTGAEHQYNSLNCHTAVKLVNGLLSLGTGLPKRTLTLQRQMERKGSGDCCVGSFEPLGLRIVRRQG